MNIFYLISVVLGVAFQNIFQKPYTQKTSGKGVYFFSLLTAFMAMLFFVVTSGTFMWDSRLILYALLFSVSYGVATVCAVAAIGCGSLSITTLLISYSLMIPAVYGLVFLKDPISTGLIPGLVLLVVSLFLVNPKGSGEKFSLKWLIFAFFAFLGNGMCSVFQKMQQNAFDGAYKNEFMILALAMVVVFLSVFVILKERKDIKVYAKAGWHLAIACGLLNGMVNLFVMILSNRMPVSLMFPIISAGGIVVTYIVSRFFYKEKLTKTQFVGFVIGIASVVFLNI